MYASERLSLAVLEVLVHVEPDAVPPGLMSYETEIPDNLRTTTVPNDVLPPEWQDKPSHPASRALDDAWLARGGTAALLVPSAIVPGESNVLINPRHQDEGAITVVRMLPFRFDLRLVRDRCKPPWHGQEWISASAGMTVGWIPAFARMTVGWVPAFGGVTKGWDISASPALNYAGLAP